MGLRRESLLTMSTVAVCLARQKKNNGNSNCKPSVTRSTKASPEGLPYSDNNASTTDESHSAARKTKTEGKSKAKSKIWESTAAEVAMGYDSLSRSLSDPGVDDAGENESKELWELQKVPPD